MNETNENKPNETVADKAKAQLDALKTKEGRDALKGKLRRFWESGPKGKAVCIGVPVILLFLLMGRCGGGAGQAEIEFVKKSPFEGNDTVPIGAAIDRNAENVKWQLGESDAGVKYVEVTGTLKEKGKQYCIRQFGAGNNINFYKAIPEVRKMLWEEIDEYRCFWVQEPMPLPDISRLSRFLTAYAEFKKGSDIVAKYDGRTILASDPVFKAAVQAVDKGSDDEDKADVVFTMQFPMPVANYNAKGKFDPEKAVCRQGYSSIAFTKGPLAGFEIQCDLLPIFE